MITFNQLQVYCFVSNEKHLINAYLPDKFINKNISIDQSCSISNIEYLKIE
jgi:hypothetical protein